MAILSRARSLWRNLVHRAAVDADLDDELRATFDLYVDEQVAAGTSPEEARRRATLQFGRIASMRTDVIQTRSGAGIETVWRDLVFGARLLRRSPLFASTAILSLALGIGANTTMFSLVNALLLREVRVASPGQLVELWRTTQFGRGTAFSYPAYERFRDESTLFAGVIALSKNTTAGMAGTATPAAARLVSGNFFDVLGLAPAAGRLLSTRDDRPGAPDGSAVAVLSHRFWRRAFGAAPDAIGQTVRVAAVPFTIVGVAPAGFDDLVVGRPADLFIPMRSEALLRRDSLLRSAASNWLGIVARMKPDATNEAAQASLEPIFARFMADVAVDLQDAEARQRLQAQRVFLQSASAGVSDVRRDFSQPLLLLMAAVGLVLLIACANVVNLLLARGVTRRREIALRLAIGASRARVIRQLVTEAALLCAAGAVLGVAVAATAAPVILSLLTQGGSPIDLDVTPDGRVLLFTAAAAFAACLLAGLLPALRIARADLTHSFHAGPRSLSVTRETSRWGQALIAVQVALSLMLVAGAALLVATLRNIRSVPPGFEAQHVLMVGIDPLRVGYTGTRLTRYYRDVLDGVRAMPGVRAASLSRVTPISGGGIDQPIAIEGRQREHGVMIRANRLTDGFFATLAIPMRIGRDFAPEDGGRTPRAAIVDEAMAQRYFPNEDPIGRRFMLRGPEPFEIVGVVANSKYLTLREADKPTVYIYSPDSEESGAMTLSIRTAGEPLMLAGAIRDRLQAIAATVPISPPRTLTSQIERSLVNERLVARMLSGFAVLALVLASIGLHGVLGYAVTRRTGEIGLRLALGATPGGVLRSVLAQSLTAVAAGSAIGLPATLALSGSLSGLLYGVAPSNPFVLAGAVASLLLVATAAAAVPAWRAARVDPLVALRHE
jgi:predicted permease